MTRDEFINDVNDFYDLKSFCWDNDCYECEDVYDSEQRDDYLNEHIIDMARSETWESLRDILNDISSDYEFYRLDDYGDWVGLDDSDFETYKDDVLDWADNNDIWDDDDEEEEIIEDYNSIVDEEPRSAPPTPDSTEDEDLVEDGCPLNDLFSSGITQLQTIELAKETAEHEADEAFKKFMSMSF